MGVADEPATLRMSMNDVTMIFVGVSMGSLALLVLILEKRMARVEGLIQRLVAESRSDGGTRSPLTSSSATPIAATSGGLDDSESSPAPMPDAQSEAEECRTSPDGKVTLCSKHGQFQASRCPACPARGKRSDRRNAESEAPRRG